MLGGCNLFQDSSIPWKHDNTDFLEISMRPLLPVIDAIHEEKVSLHESISS